MFRVARADSVTDRPGPALFLTDFSGSPASLEYRGVELLAASPCSSDLKQAGIWPTTRVLDPDTGEATDQPERAEPHVMIVIQEEPTRDAGDRRCVTAGPYGFTIVSQSSEAGIGEIL